MAGARAGPGAGVDPRADRLAGRRRRAARAARGAPRRRPRGADGHDRSTASARTLLRDEALEAGLDPFATPVAPADRLAMLLERIDELPLASHDIRGNPSAAARLDRRPHRPPQGRARLARGLRRVGGDARPGGRPRARVRRHLRRPRPLAAGVRHARLRRPRAATPSACCGRSPACARGVGDRFRHVLVDELQDANFAQGLLLRLLAGEHGQLSAAGDDDQAIHRLRGAAAKNLRDFEAEWPRDDGRAARGEPPLPGADHRRGPCGGRAGAGPHRQGRSRARPAARSRSGSATTSAPRRSRWRPRSSGWSRARTSRPRTSACSCARSATRARRWPSRSRSARCRTGSRAPRRSSSAPRCATCWRGCGCWSTRATPAPSCARSRARRWSCARSTSPAAPRSPAAASSTWSARWAPRSSRRRSRLRRASASARSSSSTARRRTRSTRPARTSTSTA